MPLLCSGRTLTIRGYRVNPAELMRLSIEVNVRNRREEALYFRRIPRRAHLLRMNRCVSLGHKHSRSGVLCVGSSRSVAAPGLVGQRRPILYNSVRGAPN
jgi:hypothetical protein